MDNWKLLVVVVDFICFGFDGFFDGVRVVGDGDDIGFGDGDGFVIVGDFSGSWVVGGVVFDNFSDDDGIVFVVGVCVRDGGNEGSSDREFYFELGLGFGVV